ncbi:ABC transporter permease [Leucobacter soli]|uniref:ABC transporter permease n=1 Tax=Leucobacter soli TaxID=2812850 RepID=UPI00360D55FB
MAAAVGAIIHYLPQAVLLLVIYLLLGGAITWMSVAAFLAGVVIVVTFGLGLGLFFGGFNVAYRDSKNIVDLILMFATWTSPVLYTFNLVQQQAQHIGAEWIYYLYMVNPATAGVELSHTAFWEHLSPAAARPDGLWYFALVGFVISLLTLVVGQYVFHRMEGRFAQEL